MGSELPGFEKEAIVLDVISHEFVVGEAEGERFLEPVDEVVDVHAVGVFFAFVCGEPHFAAFLAEFHDLFVV